MQTFSRSIYLHINTHASKTFFRNFISVTTKAVKKKSFVKMLQVDNFLIVFSLEIGGKFIGWFGLITNAIVLPLCIVLLIGIAIDKDLKFIREQLAGMDLPALETGDENEIKKLKEYLIISLFLVIIISSIYLISSAMLIRGTTNVRTDFWLYSKSSFWNWTSSETFVKFLRQKIF